MVYAQKIPVTLCFAKISARQSCFIRWDGREIYPGPGRAVSLING